MGLGVSVFTDNLEEIWADYEWNGNPEAHQLSRTFYQLMCRQHVLYSSPELDQIGMITGADVSPFYAMEQYSSDDEEIRGNIDQVLCLVNFLIDSLSQTYNLPDRFEYEPEDAAWEEPAYFLDFTVDKGQNVLDQNFGQDLRNFRRFLEFAKTKGATTVYFHYE